MRLGLRVRRVSLLVSGDRTLVEVEYEMNVIADEVTGETANNTAANTGGATGGPGHQGGGGGEEKQKFTDNLKDKLHLGKKE